MMPTNTLTRSPRSAPVTATIGMRHLLAPSRCQNKRHQTRGGGKPDLKTSSCPPHAPRVRLMFTPSTPHPPADHLPRKLAYRKNAKNICRAEPFFPVFSGRSGKAINACNPPPSTTPPIRASPSRSPLPVWFTPHPCRTGSTYSRRKHLRLPNRGGRAQT